MKENSQNRTWVEINQKILLRNIDILKKNSKGSFMAVLKANAYGHGLIEVVSILKNNSKVDWFGVFDFQDALYIRTKSKKPILALWATPTVFWQEAQKKNISVTIATQTQLDFLFKNFETFKSLKIHIKIDTGLARQGFRIEDMEKVIGIVSKLKNKIQGLYTHFSGTENKKFDLYTKKQIKELLIWEKGFNQIGQYPHIHANATSGALRESFKASDINRFGIGLYGLFPSEEIKTKMVSLYPLTPVLSWKTKVSELKKVSQGSFIAYDCTYRTKKDAVLAIIPVGYWDGLPRSLSSKGAVLIKGQKAPIIGRIMMNMCIVDVTHVKSIKEGDIVTLLGNDAKEHVSVEEIAMHAGTINYEIVARINPLIKRTIV